MNANRMAAALLCFASTIGVAQATDQVAPTSAAHKPLKEGRSTVYTNDTGTQLQAEVDRQGSVTGYVSVDRKGKVSKIRTGMDQVPPLGPGEIAIVHKCWAVTDECNNNPLPRSGNPEDCMVEIACPKPQANKLHR